MGSFLDYSTCAPKSGLKYSQMSSRLEIVCNENEKGKRADVFRCTNTAVVYNAKKEERRKKNYKLEVKSAHPKVFPTPPP